MKYEGSASREAPPVYCRGTRTLSAEPRAYKTLSALQERHSMRRQLEALPRLRPLESIIVRGRTPGVTLEFVWKRAK